MNLQDIITGLNNAERFGGETDTPEGTRYIILSDTIANLIAGTLQEELDHKLDRAYERDTRD